MPIEHLLKLQEKFDIQVFEKVQDVKNLKKNHVCFCGTPKKHPYSEDLIILIANPFGTNTTYYEFNISDISYVEKISNEVNLSGETVTVARIWIEKGSVGNHCIPFQVEEVTMPKIL